MSKALQIMLIAFVVLYLAIAIFVAWGAYESAMLFDARREVEALP